MVIFATVIGALLCLQGVAALADLFRWRRLRITSTTRRLAGVAYLCLGGLFILAGFWRLFFVGVFLALIALVVVQRKIIIERKAGAGA